jgi:hypothetical protein
MMNIPEVLRSISNILIEKYGLVSDDTIDEIGCVLDNQGVDCDDIDWDHVTAHCQ